jgi:hypothetical protein
MADLEFCMFNYDDKSWNTQNYDKEKLELIEKSNEILKEMFNKLVIDYKIFLCVLKIYKYSL